MFNIHLFIITSPLSIITRDMLAGRRRRGEIQKKQGKEMQKKEHEIREPEKKYENSFQFFFFPLLDRRASSGNIKAIKHLANEVLITYNR